MGPKHMIWMRTTQAHCVEVFWVPSRPSQGHRGCLDTSANFYVLVTSASEAFSGPETAKRQR